MFAPPTVNFRPVGRLIPVAFTSIAFVSLGPIGKVLK